MFNYADFDFYDKRQYTNTCLTHLISCSALLRFMYCLTVCCTNGPKRDQNISTVKTKLPSAKKKRKQRKKFVTFNLYDSLQLSGMTLRARGRRSSKEASNTNDWISGYDIAAQLAEKVNREEEGKNMKSRKKHNYLFRLNQITTKSSQGTLKK